MRTGLMPAGALVACALLVACGGGGSNPAPPAPAPAPSPAPADTTAPQTSLDSHPESATRSQAAGFTFSSENGATFEASLDGAAFAAATSPVSFTDLAPGSHTFAVRARDAAGNVDDSPATFTWGVDHVPPSARIAFPTALSYSDASVIAVRGNANDAHGVAEVRVNGVLANTLDGFQNWRADVPLAAGENSLTVSVRDAAGNETNAASSAKVVNRGPPVFLIRGIDFDATGERIIVGDRQMNIVYAVDPATGYSQLVSPASAITGPLFRLTDLAVDASRNRAVLIDSYLNALVAVDLATGARQVLAPASLASSDTNVTDTSFVAVDGTRNRAFVLRTSNLSVIEIDLATGVRQVISSTTLGNGDHFCAPRGILYDEISVPGTPRLLVTGGVSTDLGCEARLTAVELATGDRSVVSSAADFIGTGITFGEPAALRMDATNRRVIVRDSLRAIFAVDLDTGDRTQLAGEFTGSGSNFDNSVRGIAFNSATGNVYIPSAGSTMIGLDTTTLERTLLLSTSIGSGTALGGSEGIVVEQSSGTAASLLLAERGYRSLVRLNLASGQRSVVSSQMQNVGTGNDFFAPSDVVLDTRPGSNGHTAIALVDAPLNALVSVDLLTGNRTMLQPLGVDLQSLGIMRSLRLDAAGNRAYFSATVPSQFNSLYSINLATGALQEIAGGPRGSGHIHDRASNFVLLPASNPTRALLADEGPGGVFSVDFATGDRTEFLAPWPEDSSPGASVMGGSYLDTPNARLLGVRVGSESNVFSVSLTTGAQRVISGEDPVTGVVTGRGPVPFGAFAMDVNDGIAYLANYWTESVYAVDLVSGDRVIIAR